MKKYQYCFFAYVCALTLLFECLGFSYSEGGRMVYAEEIVYSIDNEYEYPITPESEIWSTFSAKEKKSICDVAPEVAQQMTTRALLLTVLHYPYIVDIFGYDSLLDGIDAVKSSFAPLAELFEREDLIITLEDILAELDEENVDYVVANAFLQLLYGVTPLSIVDPITGGTQAQVCTPRGSVVLCFRDLTWSDFGITYEYACTIRDNFEATYDVVRIRDVSTSYNCHSYAWHSTSSANPYWMNNPSRYILDGSYANSIGSVGDKITYWTEDQGYTHSGIVIGTGRVRSKWGCLGLYEHDVDECPYAENSVENKYWARTE